MGKEKCKVKIKKVVNYELKKGKLPVISVCIVETNKGKFAKGTAICNELDVIRMKDQLVEEGLPVKLLAERLSIRGAVIAKGRAISALKKGVKNNPTDRVRVFAPVKTAEAYSKIFSVQNGPDAFVERKGRLWKSVYHPPYFSHSDINGMDMGVQV